MALEYLRESNSLENWFTYYKWEIARGLIFEGLSIEQAAAKVQVSVEEVTDHMAKNPLPRAQVRRFPW